MKHHIFLSYSSKNKKIMEQVKSELEKETLTIWTMGDIKPGTPSWKRAIEDAIKNTGCLVSILTPDASASEWVREELEYAKLQEVPIFIILAEGVEKEVIPFGYTNFQVIDIRNGDWSKLPRLIAEIKTQLNIPSGYVVAAAPTPTEPAVEKISKAVFISAPLDSSLNPAQVNLKTGIIDLVRQQGFQPQLFGELGVAAYAAWTFDNVDEMMRRCEGAIMLGLTRWQFNTPDDTFRFATEYTHFEGGLAVAHKLPTLIITEDGLSQRGVYYTGSGRYVLMMPPNADAAWLQTNAFMQPFLAWAAQI